MRLFTGLVQLAFYLGVGALLHAVMVGPRFDWSSAWTWGWLLGWPIALLITFYVVVFVALVVCVLVAGYLAWRG